MFFKRPKVGDVRARLVQLVRDAKEELQRQANSSTPRNKLTDEAPMSLTLTVLTLSVGQLVPSAKRILTRDVAIRVSQSSYEEASELVKLDVAPAIPKEDVDLYLDLVLATVEAWLGYRSQMVREIVGNTGQFYHVQLGMIHSQSKEWSLAEDEFRRALGYDLLRSFGPSRIVNLINVGTAFLAQQRYGEAKEAYEEALSGLPALHPSDMDLDALRENVARAEQNLEWLKDHV